MPVPVRLPRLGAHKCELVRWRSTICFPSIGRVRQAASPQLDFAPGIQVEHVCLESDELVFDGRCLGAPVGPSLTITSQLRGCMTELTVLEGHQLAVRTQRPQRPERRYVLDLRFIDGEPVTRRFIAWRCWLASVALAALAGAGYRLAAMPEVAPWLHMALPGSIGSLAAAVCIGMLALYRTHETIQLRSVHGRAVLVEITGSPGCSRSAAAFAAEMARRIDEARARVAQSKQRFLCDELHEHRRLLEEGVLAPDVYEAGKRRILRAHD